MQHALVTCCSDCFVFASRGGRPAPACCLMPCCHQYGCSARSVFTQAVYCNTAQHSMVAFHTIHGRVQGKASSPLPRTIRVVLDQVRLHGCKVPTHSMKGV
jgi:hypothetical protein